ncbi:hypothetical protein ACFQO9_13930 [Chryseobacterium zhengzhouense]|uniref:DUF4843 domain-containing protein n=1 Tax=Chryseobacterium zhengzhouense TaxID=1636086 RepID=A0ABW2LYY9_9FLAO
MKNIIAILILLMFNMNCTEKIDKNQNKNFDMKINQIPLKNQISYGLEVNAPIPVIIYFNDIKISEKNTPVNTVVELNPYILKNGKHKIKIKVNPLFRSNETFVNSDNLNKIRIQFVSYIWNKETDDVSNFMTNINLPLTEVKESIPYFEQEWEVEIKDLPYELEGWSKGQDLSKMNQKELEQKVVHYYEKLRNLMNNGDFESYQNLWTTAHKELLMYDYQTENSYNKAMEENALDFKKCKNTMIPLEDYEMKLHADGKMVSLERKTHTREFNNENPLDIKGWSPLIRKYKVSGGASYGVKLYLPQNSSDFVIIRK